MIRGQRSVSFQQIRSWATSAKNCSSFLHASVIILQRPKGINGEMDVLRLVHRGLKDLTQQTSCTCWRCHVYSVAESGRRVTGRLGIKTIQTYCFQQRRFERLFPRLRAVLDSVWKERKHRANRCSKFVRRIRPECIFEEGGRDG